MTKQEFDQAVALAQAVALTKTRLPTSITRICEAFLETLAERNDAYTELDSLHNIDLTPYARNPTKCLKALDNDLEKAKRLKALDDLIRLTEELGLYDQELTPLPRK
jgi:hypothetical protein